MVAGADDDILASIELTGKNIQTNRDAHLYSDAWKAHGWQYFDRAQDQDYPEQ